MIDGSKRGLMQVKDVQSFLDSVLDDDIHTKRIASPLEHLHSRRMTDPA